MATKLGYQAYSGVLTTAGNLVFVGHNDGRLIAFDAKTGDQVVGIHDGCRCECSFSHV